MAIDQRETLSNLPESENEFSVYFHYEDGELLAGKANCNGLQGWGIALQEGIFVFGKFRDGKLIVDATPMASWLFETFEFVSKERGCLEFSDRVIGQNRYLFGVEMPQNKFVGFSLCVDGTLSTHIIDDVSHIDTVNVFYADDTIQYFKIKPQEFVKEISKVDFYMQCGAKPEFMQVDNNIIDPETLKYGEKYKLKVNIGERTYTENNRRYNLYDIESIVDSKGKEPVVPLKYIISPHGSNIKRIFQSSKWELPLLTLHPMKILGPSYTNHVYRDYNTDLDDFCIHILDARPYGGNRRELALLHKSCFEKDYREYVKIHKLHRLFDLTSISIFFTATLFMLIHIGRICLDIQPYDKLNLFGSKLIFPYDYIFFYMVSVSLFHFNRYRILGFMGLLLAPLIIMFKHGQHFDSIYNHSDSLYNIIITALAYLIVFSIFYSLLLQLKDKRKRTLWEKIKYLYKPRHRQKARI